MATQKRVRALHGTALKNFTHGLGPCGSSSLEHGLNGPAEISDNTVHHHIRTLYFNNDSYP
jgi:hypothetical protein